MIDSKRFLFGFLSVVSLFAVFYFVLFILLSKAGELNIDAVINVQIANEKSLFSSGLGQNSYQYKLKLMDAVRPEVVAIGSSRAMQVRKQFFKSSFVNLGGTVNGVATLEAIINDLVLRKQKPKLALVFLDPWWHIKDSARDDGVTASKSQSNDFSLPLGLAALKALKYGNWIAKLNTTSNAGIHAILTGEGYGQDGSFHYVDVLTGRSAIFADQLFSDTLNRIGNSNSRFEKAERPDSNLLSRTCSALQKLNSQIEHVVVIAPPFAPVVWMAMAKGGYEYIHDSNNKIAECIGLNVFHSFVTGKNIPNNNDCEFIDGFHGGDVTYARIISLVSNNDAGVRHHVDRNYLDKLIDENSGLAGPVTQQMFLINEIDFLKIGCSKKPHH